MIYAIGVESKRHAIYTKGAPLGTEDFRLVEADADGWIEWHGGECPLPGGAPFEARRRDGEMAARVDSWLHGYGGRDIIAYRPILDAKPDEMSPEIAQYAKAWRDHYGESTKPEASEWDGEGLPPRWHPLRSA